MKFVYDTKNMGESQRSLDALKDALSVGSKKVVLDTVLQVNMLKIRGSNRTNPICRYCGFAVIYCGEDEQGKKEFICYFTGDGFRTDGCGEGGCAYAQAHEVLQQKGIEPTVIHTDIKPSTTVYEYIGSVSQAIEIFLLNKRESVAVIGKGLEK